MAVDTFLELDGIKGESIDDKNKDMIDVLGWGWGMNQSGSFGTGGGGGAGKVDVQDIQVTKYVDKATPELMLHCCNGKHIPKGKIIVRKAGENPIDYLTIEFEKLLVTSVSTGGGEGVERLTENVTLNFSTFKAIYTPQKEDGTGDAAVETGWDVGKNVKK